MTKKLIVANWKMNPQTSEEARVLASRVEHGFSALPREKIETVICPPYLFLPVLRHTLHFTKLGAQNISAESHGAYTGQISAKQVKGFGATFAIIGHSEVRAAGETDALINRKIKLALASKMHPVFCVGHGTRKSSSQANIKDVIKRQLLAGLDGVKYKPNILTVAYEPVWAISQGLGSGKAVAPKHAVSIISFIKSMYKNVRVIYGGSIEAKNTAGFANEEVIDGGLVGGASLAPEVFLSILKAFSA